MNPTKKSVLVFSLRSPTYAASEAKSESNFIFA
jgi:hypothetical protein